ncbi:hypothetical protein [Nitrosomonas communis]|uniref:Uncharacterized protein n=1 Tax=Nitrosomonas communis TaxID=44574 RepID=A0A1I4RDR7_9PROT|nr:hypothetical protein [Nitrosomonas communis]SFM50428.1 hypothetical protein SAMN05421863_103223 [Nitrosomonas communis]
MPGSAKTMETGNEQSEAVHTMPGEGLSNEDISRILSSGMGGGSMNGDKGNELSSGMPGSNMSSDKDGMVGDKGGDTSSGMPGGNMDGDGGGGGNDGGGTPRSRSCATMDVHRRLLSRYPSYARARDEIENLAFQYAMNPEAVQRPGVTRIPVTVHVVWNTPQQNISDAQINSHIDILNRDFRRTNPDVNNTPALFLPLIADARIEFFLANIDPNGAPSTGIDRSNDCRFFQQ